VQDAINWILKHKKKMVLGGYLTQLLKKLHMHYRLFGCGARIHNKYKKRPYTKENMVRKQSR